MRAQRCLLFGVVLAVAGCANSQPTAAQEAPAGQAAVLATVNGTAITEDEVRASLGNELARLEGQVYDLKRQQLEALIAERLLDAEAARRGVSRQVLDTEEVTAKVTPLTDEEVNGFIAANRARIPDPVALRPQIVSFLEARKVNERRAAFVDSLRTGADVQVSLTPPATFRASLDIEGAPVRGAADAPVTIVEFSDFHCPFCRSVQPTLTTLLERYPGKVRLVYKHLPLDDLHPQARRASEASWCADRQGKFWEFHDALYRAGSSDASDTAMAGLAKGVGLDEAQFTTCMNGPEASRMVARDTEQGQTLGLTGTPGFFINGRELTGAQPLEAFVRVIDEELAGRP